MELRNTTKMALQAALAIGVAECLSLFLFTDKGYWITLSAMALTTQTWGESVKRSFERVGMTILGGIAGTALYFYLPDNYNLVLGFLLLFIFFTTYMMPIYHLVAVFFLTCFVVFLFALIGHWDWLLLKTRVIDTIVGAGVALFVGSFFFPLRRNVSCMFVLYLQKMKASLDATIHPSEIRSPISNQQLAVDFQEIKHDAMAIRYQLLFHRLNAQQFNALLQYVGFCVHFTINIIESYKWLSCRLCDEEIPMVKKAVETTEHNIQALVDLLEKKPCAQLLPVTNVSDLLQHEINRCPKRFSSLESDALGFFSLMYFFTQLNINLNHAFDMLNYKR
jgi:hypothetical protein